MTRKEYLKYNNTEAFDALNKPIKIGDTVILNNYFGTTPYIGIVDHFTESKKLAILYTCCVCKGKNCIRWFYRFPNTVIKLKNGNKSNSENKLEGQP